MHQSLDPAHEPLDPIAAPTDCAVRVLSTSVQIQKLTVERPNVVAYLQNIPADKLEIALVHALEVGVTELVARRQRFGQH
jgi:hypothetical protein